MEQPPDPTDPTVVPEEAVQEARDNLAQAYLNAAQDTDDPHERAEMLEQAQTEGTSGENPQDPASPQNP